MPVRVDAGAGACGFGLGAGLDADLGAFATLLRLRREADFSLRNSALSAFNSFFNDLIFLSFFDIALRSPTLVQRLHRTAIRR